LLNRVSERGSDTLTTVAREDQGDCEE